MYSEGKRSNMQIANLIAENDVSQTKVDQEKWQYQWSKYEVCYTKNTKETNPFFYNFYKG